MSDQDSPGPRNAGLVATAAAARMEREHEWYRRLSADDRSWVGLVAQAGINAFLAWYREGNYQHAPPVTTDIFGTAPAELAHTITLRQTLDLVRTTIDVVEEQITQLASDGEEQALREAILIYSREVAFAAAQIYASAAESRGAWDARLESLVVHAVMRGEADETLRSRAAELGWESVTSVTVLAGVTPLATSGVTERIRRSARRLDIEALSSVQGSRIVCVLGSVPDPLAAATELGSHFGPGALVVGPAVPHLFAAGRSARAALSGLDAVRAWPQAPRPVLADDLLPERALHGEAYARRHLVDRVYRPLREASTGLLETCAVFLESGRSLEGTARTLFVHANTVRYRIRRISQTVGLDISQPRDAWIAQVALALGRMDR